MRPLRYSINVSLDGCVDHTAGSPDEEIHNHAARVIARADAIILGRATYELMEFWRTAEDLPTWMQPFADSINAAKKYLVSSTREPDGWNTEALRGDPVEAVRKLKEQPGDGLYVGGVTLPLALADAGLIDEYEFVVYPTLIGHGPKLFDGLARPLDLRHVGTEEFSSGVRAERYVPISRLSDSVDSDDSVPDDENTRGAVPRERWRVLPAQVPLDEQSTSEPASHAPDPEAGRNPDNDWLLRGI